MFGVRVIAMLITRLILTFRTFKDYKNSLSQPECHVCLGFISYYWLLVIFGCSEIDESTVSVMGTVGNLVWIS